MTLIWQRTGATLIPMGVEFSFPPRGLSVSPGGLKNRKSIRPCTFFLFSEGARDPEPPLSLRLCLFLNGRRRRVYLQHHYQHSENQCSHEGAVGQGRPPGPNGLDCLKVHTINLTGQKKKQSVSKRRKGFAMQVKSFRISSTRPSIQYES
jgi:hypothetical protein